MSSLSLFTVSLSVSFLYFSLTPSCFLSPFYQSLPEAGFTPADSACPGRPDILQSAGYFKVGFRRFIHPDPGILVRSSNIRSGILIEIKTGLLNFGQLDPDMDHRVPDLNAKIWCKPVILF